MQLCIMFVHCGISRIVVIENVLSRNICAVTVKLTVNCKAFGENSYNQDVVQVLFERNM